MLFSQTIVGQTVPVIHIHELAVSFVCINVSSKLKKKGENEADGKNALDTEWAEVTEGLKIRRGGGKQLFRTHHLDRQK